MSVFQYYMIKHVPWISFLASWSAKNSKIVRARKTTWIVIIWETRQQHHLNVYSFVIQILTVHYPFFQQALQTTDNHQHSMKQQSTILLLDHVKYKMTLSYCKTELLIPDRWHYWVMLSLGNSVMVHKSHPKHIHFRMENMSCHHHRSAFFENYYPYTD